VVKIRQISPYPFPKLSLEIKVFSLVAIANFNFLPPPLHINTKPTTLHITTKTLKMPPELIPSDSDYASEEDSDFAPDTAPAPELESSDSESDDEATAGNDSKGRSKVEGKGKGKKRKRGGDEEAEDLGFENSGDEAVIKEYDSGGAAKRKKGKKGRVEELEDEGGEGGVVRTRSMRALEYVFFLSFDLHLLVEKIGFGIGIVLTMTLVV
jgi:hypothetical protein